MVDTKLVKTYENEIRRGRPNIILKSSIEADTVLSGPSLSLTLCLVESCTWVQFITVVKEQRMNEYKLSDKIVVP